jgi:hypothetical protein
MTAKSTPETDAEALPPVKEPRAVEDTAPSSEVGVRIRGGLSIRTRVRAGRWKILQV